MWNSSSIGEENCLLNQVLVEEPEVEELRCPRVWDGLMCWQTTAAGDVAVQPCLPELNGVRYDPSGVARRYCFLDGKWDNFTNYSDCQALLHLVPVAYDDGHQGSAMVLASWLYMGGYIVSLLALGLAISIFLCFKELRCLRNTIHTHLMTTYVMADALWVTAVAYKTASGSSSLVTCACFVLLHYFHLTNLFWMLVEGLYLYVLVVRTFSVDNIPLRIYLGVGWGIPIVVVSAWAASKAMSVGGAVVMESRVDVLEGDCPWLHESGLDWMYKAPALVVLALNMGFLGLLMRVLVTKLRVSGGAGDPGEGRQQSQHQQQTQRRQSHKAAKALLVLMPLLGANYVLLIVAPTRGPVAQAFAAIRALLLASQGFLVALLYCFMNAEVRHVLHHRWGRWRAVRGALGSLGSTLGPLGPLGTLSQRTRGGPGATQALLSRGSARRSLLRSRSLCIRLNPLSVSMTTPPTVSKASVTTVSGPNKSRPRTSSASEATLSTAASAVNASSATGRRSPEDSSQDAAL